MSMNTPIGLKVFEKLLGLILIIIGAIVALNATTLLPSGISQFSGIFTFIGVVVLAVGALMLVTKAE